MLKNILRRAASLLYPLDCGTCGKLLPPSNTLGVCLECDASIQTLTPPFCSTCARPLKNEVAHCADCRSERFSFDRAFACTKYEGKMKTLILDYKFRQRKYLKHFFFKKMDSFVDANLKSASFDAVASVPLDREKQNERGFNQSELLSKNLSKRLKLSHLSGKLKKQKSGSPQSLLSKKERSLNVKNTFLVRDPHAFRDKKVLLVDDILTTGQTASECARALKKAGAKEVTVLVLARGVLA